MWILLALTLDQIGLSKAPKRASERVFQRLALMRNRDSQLENGINRVYEFLWPLAGWGGQAARCKVLWSRSWKLVFKFDIGPVSWANLGNLFPSLDLGCIPCRVGVVNSSLPFHHQRHLLLSLSAPTTAMKVML